MIGQTISRFKILDKLGEGGMGEVYLAEDTELQRKIALKFLPPHYSRDKELNTRFKREARIAGALNHPNIVTIHEVGEFGGRTFIAMEYVEGESLRERLAGEGLSQDEVLDYTAQLCAGLGKAHETGIIHRDLKPENVVVDRDGRLRILDFGLAKFEEGTKLTRQSSTLGTLSYMSPEQFENTDVDHRTDIWSLGVMVYEMLAGRAPFEGEYEAAVMYSIMNESPQPVSTQSKRIPTGLDAVVDRALAKGKEDRYSSAEEFLEDLKRILRQDGRAGVQANWSLWRVKQLLRRPAFYLSFALLILAGGSFLLKDRLFARRPVRIAVLPFETPGLTEQEKAEVGGLWTESVDDLLTLKQVRPLTRAIAKRYGGEDFDLDELKLRYSQDFVIRTVAAKEGDEYRFRAYLTDLDDFSEVARKEFTAGLLNFRSEYPSLIYATLGMKMPTEEAKYLAQRPTQDRTPYAYYLRGSNAVTNSQFDLALKIFDQALEIDPNFSLAYSGRAMANIISLETGFTNDPSFRDNAERDALEALRHDENGAEARATLGLVYLYKGRYRDSYEEARKALAVEPRNVLAKMVLVNVYQVFGLSDRAFRVTQEILEIDELYWPASMLSGAVSLSMGKYERALSFFNNALKFYPRQIRLLTFSAWAYMALGQLDEAREVIDRARQVNPRNFEVRTFEAILLAAQGRVDEARGLLTPDLLQYFNTNPVNATWLIRVYALLHEADPAIMWMKRRFDFGWEGYTLYVHDPLIDNLRQDPRFQEMMGQLEARWVQHKKEFK